MFICTVCGEINNTSHHCYLHTLRSVHFVMRVLEQTCFQSNHLRAPVVCKAKPQQTPIHAKLYCMSNAGLDLFILIVRLASTSESSRISHLTEATNTIRPDGPDPKGSTHPCPQCKTNNCVCWWVNPG